jgi:hypothetical protein
MSHVLSSGMTTPSKTVLPPQHMIRGHGRKMNAQQRSRGDPGVIASHGNH